MHANVVPYTRRVRFVRRDDSWTYRETEILREFWPDVAALRKVLPHRSEQAIKDMAKRCGIVPPKDQHIWTAAEDKRLKAMAAEGSTRKEMAAILGLTWLQVANRLNYTKTNIARRPPALCGDALADAVRQRAFHMNISMTDLDRSLGNNQIFQNAISKKKVLPNHIDKAVKALGGRLVVVWDDAE